MSTKSKNQIDMTTGSLFRKIITFAIPLILTNMLQLFYNAADMIIVGQFAGPQALSAVGASGALVNTLIGSFMGLSVGAGVSVSKNFGAKDEEGISRTLHTAISVSLMLSLFITVLGIFAARPLLELMQTPYDVIDGSTLYMRIFFLGMPFNLTYNFGAAMLRAVGDTKRPLKFLAFAGVINVLFNLFFVIVLRMSVAGVALATIISQAISAYLVIKCFLKGDEILKLNLKSLKIHKKELYDIIRIGLPSGIQGSLFSLSNATVQSAINSFGSTVVAGNVAASNLEGFAYVAVNSISQAALTAAAQNIGAEKYNRARKGLWHSLLVVAIVSISISLTLNIFATPLLSLYNSDMSVVSIGINKLRITSALYVLFGLMDVVVGQLRGMGASLTPTLISLGGVCAFRILWVATVFPIFGTIVSIYWVYPLSWLVTLSAQGVMYKIVQSKYPNLDADVAQV